MTLRYIPFDDSYRAAYRQVSRVIRHKNLMFTCGQLDADGNGIAQNLSDLQRQTERCVALINDAIEQAGGAASDVVKLQVFYRSDRHTVESDYQRLVNSLIEPKAKPMINFTPIATFPKGVEVEMDAIALIGANKLPQSHAAQGDCEVIRRDQLIFGRADISDPERTDAKQVVDQLATCLEAVGSKMGDFCRLRFYQENLSTTPSPFERSLAQGLATTPVVYTRLPLVSATSHTRKTRLEFEGLCCDADSGNVLLGQHGSWPDVWNLGYAPAIHRDNLLFVGGQLETQSRELDADVNADMQIEVNAVMQHIATLLNKFGTHFGHVAKVNAYYAGHDSLQTWTANVQSRCDYYPQPGPASTGVEVTTVGLNRKRVCVDCTAILDSPA